MHIVPNHLKNQNSLRLTQRMFLLVFLFLTALSTCIASQPAAASSAGAVMTNIEKIDDFINSAMQEKRIPGAAVAIMHDDQVVHLRGFGKADESGRAITAQTPFAIGSMTKSFTALAIMQLVEQGKLTLTAPVQRYLPWFRVADAAASSRISIADLLHHTSGIPANAAIELDSIVHPDITVEQYVRALNTVALDRPAGSTFEYSNTNYVILGLLVQNVSGQSYVNYMQQHILDPLEMHNTFFSYEQAQRHGAAVGYNWLFGAPVPVQQSPSQAQPFPRLQLPETIPQAQLPAGGLVSSVEDLSHFLSAMMNGGRYGATSILSAQGILALQTPAVSIPPSVHAGEQGGYGMGWYNGSFFNVPAIFHTGTTFSTKTFQVMEPQRHWGAILLTNISTQWPVQEPFDYIRSGVTHLLVGRAPEPLDELSLNTFYLIFDSILGLITLLLLGNLALLPHWYRRLPGHVQSSQHKKRFIGLQILRAALEVVLAVVFIAGTAVVLGNGSFTLALLLFSDLSLWLLAAGTVLLISGLVRGVLLWQQLRTPEKTNGGIRPEKQVALKA